MNVHPASPWIFGFLTRKGKGPFVRWQLLDSNAFQTRIPQMKSLRNKIERILVRRFSHFKNHCDAVGRCVIVYGVSGNPSLIAPQHVEEAISIDCPLKHVSAVGGHRY